MGQANSGISRNIDLDPATAFFKPLDLCLPPACSTWLPLKPAKATGMMCCAITPSTGTHGKVETRITWCCSLRSPFNHWRVIGERPSATSRILIDQSSMSKGWLPKMSAPSPRGSPRGGQSQRISDPCVSIWEDRARQLRWLSAMNRVHQG